jgi:hypothetical protein
MSELDYEFKYQQILLIGDLLQLPLVIENQTIRVTHRKIT